MMMARQLHIHLYVALGVLGWNGVGAAHATTVPDFIHRLVYKMRGKSEKALFAQIEPPFEDIRLGQTDEVMYGNDLLYVLPSHDLSPEALEHLAQQHAFATVYAGYSGSDGPGFIRPNQELSETEQEALAHKYASLGYDFLHVEEGMTRYQLDLDDKEIAWKDLPQRFRKRTTIEQMVKELVTAYDVEVSALDDTKTNQRLLRFATPYDCRVFPWENQILHGHPGMRNPYTGGLVGTMRGISAGFQLKRDEQGLYAEIVNGDLFWAMRRGVSSMTIATPWDITTHTWTAAEQLLLRTGAGKLTIRAKVRAPRPKFPGAAIWR